METHSYRGSSKFSEGGADEGASDSGGVAVTSDTVSESYGAWVEIIASTPRDAQMVIIHLGPRQSTTGFGSHVQIGVGASGSEKVKIDGCLIRTATDERRVQTWPCPIFIPAGTRLSARAADSSTSALTCDVSITLAEGGPWPGAPLQYNERDDGGATGFGWGGPDPGASANTKGAWDELVAATTIDWKAMLIDIEQNSAAMGDDNWLIDIGIGGAGSEKVKIPNLRASAGATKDQMMPSVIGPIKVDIPRGTRIVDRSQSTDVTADVRKPLIAIVGFG